MTRRGAIVGCGLLVLLAWWAWAAFAPAPIILDLPALMRSPLPSLASERGDGLYWADIRRPGFARLEAAALTPRGPIEIVTGEFDRPVGDRKRAMLMLGTGDRLAVTHRAPLLVTHRGAGFAELNLFRRSTSEYTGFWAAAAP